MTLPPQVPAAPPVMRQLNGQQKRPHHPDPDPSDSPRNKDKRTERVAPQEQSHQQWHPRTPRNRRPTRSNNSTQDTSKSRSPGQGLARVEETGHLGLPRTAVHRHILDRINAINDSLKKGAVVLHAAPAKHKPGQIRRWIKGGNQGNVRILGIRWLLQEPGRIGKLASSLVIYLQHQPGHPHGEEDFPHHRLTGPGRGTLGLR